jgi:hypothetical protein
MTTIGTAPGSMATGSGAGGGGGGGKAPGGGGKKPDRPHYYAWGGDEDTDLWLYDLRSASSYVIEWCKYSSSFSEASIINRPAVEMNANRPVDIVFIRELAHFLWQLSVQGLAPGPNLRISAVHRDDRESYMSPTSIRFVEPPPSVRKLFGMSTTRGFYSTNVEASK